MSGIRVARYLCAASTFFFRREGTPMTTDVDQATAQEFAGRMLGVVNAASTAFGLGIGEKLGLFDTLAGLDPSTS